MEVLTYSPSTVRIVIGIVALCCLYFAGVQFRNEFAYVLLMTISLLVFMQILRSFTSCGLWNNIVLGAVGALLPLLAIILGMLFPLNFLISKKGR